MARLELPATPELHREACASFSRLVSLLRVSTGRTVTVTADELEPFKGWIGRACTLALYRAATIELTGHHLREAWEKRMTLADDRAQSADDERPQQSELSADKVAAVRSDFGNLALRRNSTQRRFDGCFVKFLGRVHCGVEGH